MPSRFLIRTPLLLPALLASLTHAAEDPGTLLPRIDVVGSPEDLPLIAGAGDVLDERDLRESHVFTVNEALRKVPGVHVRDEEGFGLRPNIGMRGLNPTRSTKATLLENGIPLAFAPYGDNASYYHPQIDRYERIEVLRGAGSLLFGPQTIAGVINYITPVAPDDFHGIVEGTFGNRAYANGRLRVGGNGLLFDYTHKRGDGARDNLEHAVNDVNLQYSTAIGARQALTLRANYYTEDSTVTYSGLTQAEFENLGARYNPFGNDEFGIERTGFSATHELAVDAITLTTSLYYSKFDRDWWRQSSNSTDAQHAGCNATVTIDGVTDTFTAHRLAGRAVDPSAQFDCVQGRLRSYTTWGIEPRLTWTHGAGELQAGLKLHYEEQDRRQLNGTSPTARTGTLAEDNTRDVDAWSAFIANRFDLGTWSFTPVLRHESIDAGRVNLLASQPGSTSVSETLYGLGITWNPLDTLTAFASVHRGFAPPRVEDLIGGTGTATDVDPEESLNLELGLRAQLHENISLQAALFRNDFDNLIAVGSIAGGSTPLSQGEALFQGLELGAESGGIRGPFTRLAWTWLPTARQSTAFRNVATDALVGVAGNRQPYAPRHTLTAAAGYRTARLSGEVEMQHVGRQYTDFANTVTPTADGQRGAIGSHAIFHAALNVRWNDALTGFVTVKNLADRTYIVDRTRGIQAGIPRLVQLGASYSF